jgi:hypothetical protein
VSKLGKLSAKSFPGASNGGGQAQPDLFCPTIRVPLRTTQAESKRANAK